MKISNMQMSKLTYICNYTIKYYIINEMNYCSQVKVRVLVEFTGKTKLDLCITSSNATKIVKIYINMLIRNMQISSLTYTWRLYNNTQYKL